MLEIWNQIDPKRQIAILIGLCYTVPVLVIVGWAMLKRIKQVRSARRYSKQLNARRARQVQIKLS